MREILFRGKRVDNGEWLEGYYLCQKNHYIGTKHYIYVFGDKEYNKYCDEDSRYEVDPATVDEYTGLQDKNGQKIFEGDIVEKTLWWRGKIDGKIRGVITFDHADYVISWNQETHISRYISSIDNMGSLEIIGNVHDNPELLEVK